MVSCHPVMNSNFTENGMEPSRAPVIPMFGAASGTFHLFRGSINTGSSAGSDSLSHPKSSFFGMPRNLTAGTPHTNQSGPTLSLHPSDTSGGGRPVLTRKPLADPAHTEVPLATPTLPRVRPPRSR